MGYKIVRRNIAEENLAILFFEKLYVHQTQSRILTRRVLRKPSTLLRECSS